MKNFLETDSGKGYAIPFGFFDKATEAIKNINWLNIVEKSFATSQYTRVYHTGDMVVVSFDIDTIRWALIDSINWVFFLQGEFGFNEQAAMERTLARLLDFSQLNNSENFDLFRSFVIFGMPHKESSGKTGGESLIAGYRVQLETCCGSHVANFADSLHKFFRINDDVISISPTRGEDGGEITIEFSFKAPNE